MLRILHLFVYDKFTEAYIRFVTDNFTDSYHQFWVYGNKIDGVDRTFLRMKNVKYYRYIAKQLQSEKVGCYDKIIIHGFFDQDVVNFFFTNRKLLDKLYIYFWGGDKFYIADFKNNLKRKYVINHARGIINIIPEEKKFMRENYRIKGKFYVARYYSYNIIHMLEKLQGTKRVNCEECNIQIGNSATPSNSHIFILRKLEKYKGENIKLYVPLSYGDRKYAKKVIEEGRKIFGDKFIPITDFYKESEYYEFLKQMDIAIFGMKRQQATGNINAQVFWGKKVFLRKNSILEHYYSHTRGCSVSSIEDIENMSYQQFISFTEKQKNNNIERMKEILDIELRIAEWNKIFND